MIPFWKKAPGNKATLIRSESQSYDLVLPSKAVSQIIESAHIRHALHGPLRERGAACKMSGGCSDSRAVLAQCFSKAAWM